MVDVHKNSVYLCLTVQQYNNKKKPRVNSGVPKKSAISAPIVAPAMLHRV